MDANLGPAALFSNSTVDINSVCLNEELLKENDDAVAKNELENISRSTPDIQKDFNANGESNDANQTGKDYLAKRAESEPSIPLLVENQSDQESDS